MSNPDHTYTERNTTTTTTTPGSVGTGFVLGALVVVVAVIGFFVFAGGAVDTSGTDLNISVEGAGAAVESAADAVENTANQAAEGAAAVSE